MFKGEDHGVREVRGRRKKKDVELVVNILVSPLSRNSLPLFRVLLRTRSPEGRFKDRLSMDSFQETGSPSQSLQFPHYE